jgi:hypothetical protein
MQAAGMPKTNETIGWLGFGPLVSFVSGPFLLLPSSGVLDALSFEPCSAKRLLIKPLNPIRFKLLCVT